MAEAFLNYGRHQIDDQDIAAVVEALRSDWLTTGPRVESFERAFAAQVGASHAVAVSSGTAALHAAVDAMGIGPGDEVIVPSITFAATANAVVFAGGMPVFADVEPDTLLIDPRCVGQRINNRTRAIIAVDYAGQACDYAALVELAQQHRLGLIADGCHALGASQRGRLVGNIADLTAFSFHPVKHITTFEGGMITTEHTDRAMRMRAFRNHGITSDVRQRQAAGRWRYEMHLLGYNYRLSDVACALGHSQLCRLPQWIERRQALAGEYTAALRDFAGVQPLAVRAGNQHAYHLYVVRVDFAQFGVTRDRLLAELREAGIGANVHYTPVHLHPFYRDRFGTRPGLCPIAETVAEQIVTLPLFPAMTLADVQRVVETLRQALRPQARGRRAAVSRMPALPAGENA